MANDAIPYFEDGDELTCTPTANVGGKTFVVLSGNMASDGTFSIAPCGAGGQALGVALWDAVTGVRVTVHTIESGHIMPVVAGAAIAAQQPVKSDANGHAIPGVAGDKCLGIAQNGAASGADAMILLSRFTA